MRRNRRAARNELGSYRNCETICPISASARASVIYLVLHLSFSLFRGTSTLRKAALFLGVHGIIPDVPALPGENLRVLSSQKLAYRFINYGMNLLLPGVCFFFPFVREPRVRHTYKIRSRFPARLTAAAKKSHAPFSPLFL